MADAEREAATGARSEGPLHPGQLLAERYRIEARVGQGVGGFVYRADDLVAGLPVALKVLHPQPWIQPRNAEQLYRELSFGRSVHHPNVCRVHDVLEAEGRCLLVMEYASGGNLRRWLGAQAEARPLAERLADARAVVAGLAAIHQAGLIHRDVKPENILRMADGRLVISDFGLMRALEQATLTTGGVGTPGYLAPEILAGGRAEQTADVWSLGVVLHEIATGRRPGAAGHRSLPRALAPVVNACLQTDPRRRPRTAGAVQALLDSGAASARRRLAGITAVVALLAALPAGLWLSRAGQRPPPRPISRGADWSGAQVLYTARPRSDVACWQVLPPDRRTVRVADITETTQQERVPSVFDIDLATLGQRTAPTPGERYASGCPQVSPDGRGLLFPRRSGTSMQLMYAPRPDGAGAVPLVRGSHPSWLPSGRSFLFVTEDGRIAVGDLEGQVTRLERTGPAPDGVGYIAVDAAGERAAVRVSVAGERAGRWLELYDLRSRRQVGSWRLEGNLAAEVRFDDRRGAFQVPTLAGAEAILVELSSAGQLVARGHLPDASIHAAGPAAGGLVLSVIGSNSRRTFLVGPDRSTQLIGQGWMETSNLSAQGELLLSRPVGAREDPLRRLFVWRPGPGGGARLLTEDRVQLPAISLDGTVAVYHHRERGEIFACDLRPQGARLPCRLVRADPQLHDPPRPGPIGPDGDSYPYFALDPGGPDGTLLLKMLSLSQGSVREMARLRTACPVVWGWDHTFWTLDQAESHWRQRELRSGRSTGKTWPAAVRFPCQSGAPQGPGTTYDTRRESGWALRYLPDRPAAGPIKP